MQNQQVAPIDLLSVAALAATSAAQASLTVNPAAQASLAARVNVGATNPRVVDPFSTLDSDVAAHLAAASAAFSQSTMSSSYGYSNPNWNAAHFTQGPRSPQGSVSGNFPANFRRTSLNNSGISVSPTMYRQPTTSSSVSVPRVVITSQAQRVAPPIRPRARPQVHSQQYQAPVQQSQLSVPSAHPQLQARQHQWANSQAQSAPPVRGTDAAHLHPQFRTKGVCSLTCRHCTRTVCQRGMKAILLADTRVELYSTDMPLKGAVQLIQQDYVTSNCNCRIRDIACLGCGNCIGYHVTQACETCLDACNNGHFWMFHSDGVAAGDRVSQNGEPVLWGQLPSSSMRALEAKNLHSRSNTGSCSIEANNFAGMSIDQMRTALLCLDEHISAPCLHEPGASAAHEHWAACR